MPAKAKAAVEASGEAKVPTGVEIEDVVQILPPKPKKPAALELVNHLVEIPCVYLNDRNGWADFKRGLNECGLVWNFSDWMTTIVWRGVEYETIVAAGTDLDTYFPVVEKKNAGDGAESRTSALGGKLVALLGLPKNLTDTSNQGYNIAA